MNPSSTKPSLALYGGSFDPVHCAHLEVARAVLQQAEVDKVIFIPAARSPLKSDNAIASDSERVEMLRIAISGESRFELDLCEIERGGVSYTVDTLESIRGRHDGARIYWIIGADQVELLPRWHRIEAIVSKAEFLVLGRPGYSVARPAIAGLRCLEIDAPAMPHSSSEIRARLAAGAKVSDWLPDGVEAFISSRGLYTP
jgi:nicotinate-nucleotide adenylyltransferase